MRFYATEYSIYFLLMLIYFYTSFSLPMEKENNENNTITVIKKWFFISYSQDLIVCNNDSLSKKIRELGDYQLYDPTSPNGTFTVSGYTLSDRNSYHEQLNTENLILNQKLQAVRTQLNTNNNLSTLPVILDHFYTHSTHTKYEPTSDLYINQARLINLHNQQIHTKESFLSYRKYALLSGCFLGLFSFLYYKGKQSWIIIGGLIATTCTTLKWGFQSYRQFKKYPTMSTTLAQFKEDMKNDYDMLNRDESIVSVRNKNQKFTLENHPQRATWFMLLSALYNVDPVTMLNLKQGTPISIAECLQEAWKTENDHGIFENFFLKTMVRHAKYKGFWYSINGPINFTESSITRLNNYVLMINPQ